MFSRNCRLTSESICRASVPCSRASLSIPWYVFLFLLSPITSLRFRSFGHTALRTLSGMPLYIRFCSFSFVDFEFHFVNILIHFFSRCAKTSSFFSRVFLSSCGDGIFWSWTNPYLRKDDCEFMSNERREWNVKGWCRRWDKQKWVEADGKRASERLGSLSITQLTDQSLCRRRTLDPPRDQQELFGPHHIFRRFSVSPRLLYLPNPDPFWIFHESRFDSLKLNGLVEPMPIKRFHFTAEIH